MKRALLRAYLKSSRASQRLECDWTRQILALKPRRPVSRVSPNLHKESWMPRSVIEAIGNTPLIRLNKASEATGCEILGKAEFMNPGQSVKDRAALFIIRDAEKAG